MKCMIINVFYNYNCKIIVADYVNSLYLDEYALFLFHRKYKLKSRLYILDLLKLIDNRLQDLKFCKRVLYEEYVVHM